MNGPDPRAPLRLDLGRLVHLVRTHWRWLAAVHAVTAALAIGVVLVLPRWYTSSVVLVPSPGDGLKLDFTGVGIGFGGGPSLSLGGAPTPQDELKRVVMSRAVADSLVSRFDLMRRWKLERRDQARERLGEQTTVTTPKEGQVVIAVEARTPWLAHDLAAAYAAVTAEEAIRLKTSLAAQRRHYLEARLRDLGVEIDQASMRLRVFEEQHGAVALPEQTRETMEAAGTLQAQVALLETELAAERRYFTDQAPVVAVLRDRIAELKRQVERIAGQGGTLMVKGTDLPALKQQYMQLTREQVSLTAVNELLRRFYEQARVEESNPVPTFSMLDAADLPERHSRPKRGLTVVIAMMLAGAASLAYLEWRERRREARAVGSDAEELAA